MKFEPGRLHSSAGETFTAAANQGELVIPYCLDCGEVIGYRCRLCKCGSIRKTWRPAACTGNVAGAITYQRIYTEDFPPPFTVVNVALTEGPRLVALWGSEESPRTGCAVVLHFDNQQRLVATPTHS